MSRIVVGVDGSTHSNRALYWAAQEARLRSADIELVYGYAIQVHRALLTTSSHDIAERVMYGIVRANRDLLMEVKWTTTLTPLLGSSYASALVQAGDEAEMVVVGSRGLGGFKELMLGSTSYRTATHAPCPVVIIRGGEHPAQTRMNEIVVGIDDSRAARRALWWALDEAERRGVAVTVVHGYSDPADELPGDLVTRNEAEQTRRRAHDEALDLIDRALRTVEPPAGVRVERVAAAGTPASVILEHAGGRLVVVSTRGHGAIGRALVGSVSHQILHHVEGPVVVVP